MRRNVAVALFTAAREVPVGDTGGSNVSPVQAMPLRPEHAAIIAKAKERV